MSRLRAITERDRLGPLADQIERGEAVDIPRILALQGLDTAQAGRAALLDALDREDQADADLAEAIRATLGD